MKVEMNTASVVEYPGKVGLTPLPRAVVVALYKAPADILKKESWVFVRGRRGLCSDGDKETFFLRTR